MDHVRTEIWDHLFRSGPQTVEQIASRLNIDESTVKTTVVHEWFDVFDTQVRIAMERAPNSSQGRVG